MSTIYTELESYKAGLEARRKELLPYTKTNRGKNIRIINDRGHTVYRVYDSADRSVSYLSCKDMETIGSLCNKRYAEEALQIIEKNLHAANMFLKAYSGSEEWSYVDSCSEVFRNLNGNIALDYRAAAEHWAGLQYDRNPFYAKYLNHPSVRGELYRSKSESLIADCLLECMLAYNPEYPVRLKSGLTIYPDFRILVPGTFEIIYWEHFGRMDDPEYAEKNCKRIIELNNNGFIVGKNLIITFETKNCPLSKPYVMNVIKNQILK